jgi:membrane-associated phospholipid phosphatase
MLDKILAYDYLLFKWIHITTQNKFFDFLMPFMRNQYFYAPVYIFLLILMYQQFGKKGLRWCLYFFACFAFADFISASILKPMLHRVRPCNDALWFGQIRNLVPISRGFSFPSTHACNHFALSIFIIVTLSHVYKKIYIWALLWAFCVAYAQVYVGVHYPTDVLCGALLGTWVGYIIGNYFNLRTHL